MSSRLELATDWTTGALSARRAISLTEPLTDAQCRWIAAVSGTVGLTALLCDFAQSSRAIILSMHGLFAAVSALAVGRLLLPACRNTRAFPYWQLQLFLQQVSRHVYLFVYALAATRLLLFWCARGHPGASTVLSTPPESAGPIDDFQFYALCCLAPLFLIRALVALRRETTPN